MKQFKISLLFVAIIFASTVQAQTTNYQAYSLYVVNIAKYCAWPNLSGTFNITVLGKSKVYDELVKQNGKVVNGHPMKITQVANLNEISDPQIIYLPDGKSSSLDDVLKMTEGKSVMVICEREGLHRRGAGFSFIVMDNGTLRCDINNTELEKRLIKISKNLSSLTNSSI